jgi:hypothetical protein
MHKQENYTISISLTRQPYLSYFSGWDMKNARKPNALTPLSRESLQFLTESILGKILVGSSSSE